VPQTIRDRITGFVLLAVAIIWTVGVYWQIPDLSDGGTRIGPRGFPLAMGFLLALLALLMIVTAFLTPVQKPHLRVDPASHRAAVRAERWAVLATFGFVLIYVATLELFGFILATMVMVAAFLWFMIRSRSPALLIGMPLGLGFGVWFVMNQLMGVYLPKGNLLSVF
jgi:hypothetical protein